MQNGQNEELRDLRAALLLLGAQLKVIPREAETSVAFAGRCEQAARRLRYAAGVTWADYTLIKADRHAATFGLKKPPEDSVLGGARWTVREGEGLEELAGRIGMWEDTQA